MRVYPLLELYRPFEQAICGAAAVNSRMILTGLSFNEKSLHTGR